jgi:predicted nucleic acid-binding protein
MPCSGGRARCTGTAGGPRRWALFTLLQTGTPVAQLTAIPASRLQQLIASGKARPRRDISALPAPEPGPDLSKALTAMRDSEQYRRGALSRHVSSGQAVAAESETTALRAWLGEADRGPGASNLARTELLRAVRRAAPDGLLRARAVRDSITLTEVTTSLVEGASRLHPATLRSLDAIHLAAALDLGDELDSLVTYDDRLAEAARLNGIQ